VNQYSKPNRASSMAATVFSVQHVEVAGVLPPPDAVEGFGQRLRGDGCGVPCELLVALRPLGVGQHVHDAAGVELLRGGEGEVLVLAGAEPLDVGQPDRLLRRVGALTPAPFVAVVARGSAVVAAAATAADG
jgi:hypothetical protein